MSVEKCGWAIQKSLFAYTNQDSTFSYTRENSKMFNIKSRYFSFFNNKPAASWVAHAARVYLVCYSCIIVPWQNLIQSEQIQKQLYSNVESCQFRRWMVRNCRTEYKFCQSNFVYLTDYIYIKKGHSVAFFIFIWYICFI